jgi:DNA-binding LytR/AlgR family response regulator
MKVLIVEDEQPAAEKLQRYLQRYDASIEVQGIIKSVKEAVEWFSNPSNVSDLVFMDIQLLDGKSFDIFKQTDVDAPIIFTTAYDEYALEAFKVNSIAYLLKPFSFDDLTDAIEKTKRFQKQADGPLLQELVQKLQHADKSYKTRFMVKIGDHIKTIPAEMIRLFYAEGRTAYLVTNENKKFIIDYNLEQLEGLMDPAYFLRVNRSFILHINSIKDVIVYSNSRLKVIPDLPIDREIIISREKVPQFKSWIDGNQEM